MASPFFREAQRSGGGSRMKLFLEGYRSVSGISGPLLFVSGIRKAGYGELVRIETPTGIRTGQILQIQGDLCVIQVFDGTIGLNIKNTTVWFERDVVRMPVGDALIGQILSGRGQPLDGGRLSFIDKDLPITGMPINPVQRMSPNAYVETGISTIDLMNTLVRGQKLPVFSGSGLPANEIAAQIVQQAH